MQRRAFIRRSGQLSLGVGGLFLFPTCAGGNAQQSNADSTDPATSEDQAPPSELWFDLSLAQWSLHRKIRSGELDNLDFARFTREEFGIEAVEYVNQFFVDKAGDTDYLNRMKQRADDAGVRSLLIMIDGEGQLGATDEAERQRAIENHYPWVEAAQLLGCHSIRVNAAGTGSREEVAAAATNGLRKLSEYALQENINVLVENHGGYSSDGSWLAEVIRGTQMENCGTLPDFGNFCIRRTDSYDCAEEYDRYQGVRELMPMAKAVSAKSHDFTPEGQEVHTDFHQMLTIVKEAGYRGYIGIEYEGDELSEVEGIKATQSLMTQVGLDI